MAHADRRTFLRYGASLLLPAAAKSGTDLDKLQADLFPRFLRSMKARPGQVYGEGIYPTEPAIFFLAGWMLTGDPECLAAARRQFALSASWVDGNGVFDITRSKHVTYISREATAREIYNDWVAYRVLAEPPLLSMADRVASGMVRNCARVPYEYGGRKFQLFATTTRPAPPYAPSGAGIDPNQNAAIGLAFTLLYHDPKSRFHGDPAAKDIAFNELRAAMAVQNMETGAIPLTGAPRDREHYDTGYGVYAMFLWDWANRYWKDPDFALHVRKASDWIDPFYDGETRSVRWYPAHTEGRSYPQAAWRALPAFSAQGRDITRLIEVYRRGIAAEDGSSSPKWLCAQPYLYVMGLPPDVLRMAGLPAKWTRGR